MESSSASAGAGGAGLYEFTGAQNQIVGKTATWAKAWGWIGILTGALMALGGIFTLPVGVANLVFGGFYIFIGMLFKGAGDALQAVVDTAGNDIAHLMTALEKLGTAFKITGILMLIGFVLGVVAVVVAGGAAAVGAVG